MVNKIFEFEILFLSQKFELENPLDFQLQVVLLNVLLNGTLWKFVENDFVSQSNLWFSKFCDFV